MFYCDCYEDSVVGGRSILNAAVAAHRPQMRRLSVDRLDTDFGPANKSTQFIARRREENATRKLADAYENTLGAVTRDVDALIRCVREYFRSI